MGQENTIHMVVLVSALKNIIVFGRTPFGVSYLSCFISYLERTETMKVEEKVFTML